MQNKLNKLNQKGIAPIVLIIIFAVTIFGIGGIVYNSRREIKVRSDKTSESSEVKGTPEPAPKKADLNADQSGRLANKPFELKSGTADAQAPKFSLYPPDGWSKLPPDRNIVVEFLSPSKDEISEGVAYFNVQPNITVYVAKQQYKDLDEAAAAEKSKTGYTVNQKQKVKVNGEEAYIVESVQDVTDLAKNALESQIDSEIAKAGKKTNEFSKADIQKDINKLMKQARVSIISYTFYKNGYYIKVAGKAFESFWDKRKPQLKRSMDTFKFIQ